LLYTARPSLCRHFTRGPSVCTFSSPLSSTSSRSSLLPCTSSPRIRHCCHLRSCHPSQSTYVLSRSRSRLNEVKISKVKIRWSQTTSTSVVAPSGYDSNALHVYKDRIAFNLRFNIEYSTLINACGNKRRISHVLNVNKCWYWINLI